jgi:hypothetical protein
MNLLRLWPDLPKQVQQDIVWLTDLPAPDCLLSNLERVIREMEEAPGAFGPSLLVLKRLRGGAS